MTTRTLSRRLRAPEDLKIGEHIAITHTTYELLPDYLDGAFGRTIQTLSVTVIPCDAGALLRVVGVSLPFVMAENAHGDRVTIDTRRHRLTRVSKAYAKSAKTKNKDDAKKKRKGRKRCKRKKKKR